METHEGRVGGVAAVLPRAARGPVTHARLVTDWVRTLDAFGEALASDRSYLSSYQLKQLEQHLAADRRWLRDFAAIRSFP
jgi:hypothetical protein